MKKILFLFAMALMPAMMNASSELVITMTDNTKTVVALDEKPVFTFSETGLTVTTADSQVALQAERADVRDFTFNNLDGITTNTITSSVPAGLYDLNGRRIQQGTINLQTLPSGNYILKNENGTSVKVNKK